MGKLSARTNELKIDAPERAFLGVTYRVILEDWNENGFLE